jgi:ABC-type Mn2+/Zn2+ transport system ATPase subunit
MQVDTGGSCGLLITGANGTGKSAVARVLSGLWQLDNGYVIRPSVGVLGVIPQSPLGVLRVCMCVCVCVSVCPSRSRSFDVRICMYMYVCECVIEPERSHR